MPDENRDRDMLRSLLAAAGLERTETEIEALLPAYRVRRDAAARLATLDLGEAQLAVDFSAAWRDVRPAEAPRRVEGERR